MNGKYILRLDDACPTMNKKKWQKIEKLCNKYRIKPIVAVIPDNKDKLMKIDEYDKEFWSKVRKWQNKGWHIAMHGYNHVYISDKSDFLSFNKQSEFAGVDYKIQRDKIKKAWEAFKKEGVESIIWVAPSHTFDKNTLKALKKFTKIDTISDGIALFPFKKYGFKWIPQQLWKFRKMPFGVWTGCFHPNTMTDIEFKKLEKFIKDNYRNFIDINDLTYKKTILNQLFYLIFIIIFKLKRIKNIVLKK